MNKTPAVMGEKKHSVAVEKIKTEPSLDGGIDAQKIDMSQSEQLNIDTPNDQLNFDRN